MTKKIKKPYFWEFCKLDCLCDLQAGKFISASEIIDFNDGDLFPCYGGNGLRGYTKNFSHDGIFPLIGRQGALCGNINKATGKFYATEHAVVVTPNSGVDVDWLYYTLIFSNLNQYATGAAQPGLSVKNIKEILFLLPPLPEQKAIADLLSTWDEAIEKTERLIRAKEKHFKWLLRDLIYFPAVVSKKWQHVKMKNLFKERKETNRGDLRLLSITNGEGVICREKINRKDTSNDDKSKYLRICVGDIGYNTMRMWQGVSALSSLEGIVSPAYTICIPGQNLYPSFVAYLFKMPFMIHRFYSYSQGLTSDTWNLKFHHFGEVEMPLPSIEEQKQIAETLNTAQREINTLKKLAEKYKIQKRGLMQKLLTGEWRIKPEVVDKFSGNNDESIN